MQCFNFIDSEFIVGEAQQTVEHTEVWWILT